MVYNNLVYLLAVQRTDVGNALEMIQQAIAVLGPTPQLRDTRALAPAGQRPEPRGGRRTPAGGGGTADGAQLLPPGAGPGCGERPARRAAGDACGQRDPQAHGRRDPAAGAEPAPGTGCPARPDQKDRRVPASTRPAARTNLGSPPGVSPRARPVRRLGRRPSTDRWACGPAYDGMRHSFSVTQ